MNGNRLARDLAQVNEVFESVLSNIGDAVIVAGRDEKFLISNPAAQRMFSEDAMDMTSVDWPRRHGLRCRDGDSTHRLSAKREECGLGRPVSTRKHTLDPHRAQA